MRRLWLRRVAKALCWLALMHLPHMFPDAVGAPAPVVAPLAAPVVDTMDGPVAGAMVLHSPIRVFRGIPYAAPPVGPLRWRAPQPVIPWIATRDAIHFGTPCMQRVAADQLVQPSEDCLVLNVWAPPAHRGGAALPVMVFIHGGGFVYGAGSEAVYDGAALAAHHVVVVTLNYRLGVFGFLAHPALAAEGSPSGNAGLLDQIAALRWVRRNVAAFGGDPSRVCLFGESAGGTSVMALLASPEARGLFSRAILQSPAIGWKLRTQPDAERTGLVLGGDLARLRATPPGDLLAFSTRIQALAPRMAPIPLPFPVAGDAVLPSQPLSAPLPAIPIMIGDNADEGVGFAAPWSLLDRAAYRKALGTVFGGLAGEAARVYPVASDADVPAASAALVGDGMFYAGARSLARRAAAAGAPVYAYLFDEPINDHPPRHAAELRSVFGTLPPGATPQQRALSELMITAWTRFAATGDPNGPGVPTWPRFGGPDDPVLTLGQVVDPATRFHSARLDFMQRALDAGP